MKIKLKSLTLNDFKGAKENTYTFSDVVKIFGQNGAGKTTIASAWYWLMADKDTDLNSNPNIRPNDGRECTPTVRAELDIDGKPVEIAKMQKRRESKPDANGTVKISLTNSYEVNSVPKSEKDFKAYLEELGFDFSKFLPLSHPDMFLSGMNEKKAREEMRNTLFAMANTVSDLEIAKMSKETADVAKLFENYTKEEVEAMQNATLRKIREDYGKDGEILRAKIEGMEKSKADIDTAELELGKKAIDELLKSNREKQDSADKQYEEYQKLSDGILELKFAEGDLSRKANEENAKKRTEINGRIFDKNFLIDKVKQTISDTANRISSVSSHIEKQQSSLNHTREAYKTTQNLEFDENSLVCSYCGQEYPAEKKEQLRAEFETHKAELLKKVAENGNSIKASIKSDKAEVEKLKKELAGHNESLEMLNTAIADLVKQLSELPTSIDISDTEEYKAIQSQLAEKEKALDEMNSASDIRQQLKDEEEQLRRQKSELEQKIALAANNIRIDEQIAELESKRTDYEQSKADCEKILFQLSLVSRKKNELLTEQINSHFKIVNWRLFKYQKNGEYLDDCVPLIDGKEFVQETNGALKVLAKLDIIDGLQIFYNQYYPVFVDDYSLVTENTDSRVDMDCQLIKLIADKNYNYLKVEVV